MTAASRELVATHRQKNTALNVYSRLSPPFGFLNSLLPAHARVGVNVEQFRPLIHRPESCRPGFQTLPRLGFPLIKLRRKKYRYRDVKVQKLQLKAMPLTFTTS